MVIPSDLTDPLQIDRMAHAVLAQWARSIGSSSVRGYIIFISSPIAKKALPYDIPYVVSKYALSGFAEALRQELHGTDVSITTVFPARVDTPFVEDEGDEV